MSSQEFVADPYFTRFTRHLCFIVADVFLAKRRLFLAISLAMRYYSERQSGIYGRVSKITLLFFRENLKYDIIAKEMLYTAGRSLKPRRM